MDIGYNHNSLNLLGFVSTEGDGSNEPGETYLSYLPDIFESLYRTYCLN